MKILHVGDFRFDFYDDSLFAVLKNTESVIADKFEVSPYFKKYRYTNLPEKIFLSLQNRYKIGPVINKINRDLMRTVKKNKYDAIFMWRTIHLYNSTLENIRKHSVIIGYNNDQTFSPHHPWWLFRLLKKNIPLYDHFFVYRDSDLLDIKKLGVNSSLFMPTFSKAKIYPIPNADKIYDVAFIGHYENDGRDELILKLINRGFRVRLNGQRWNESRYYTEIKQKLGDIKPVYDTYNEALNSAKVCLSFLSKLNNDTYTRRTIEIPATKTVMLAEYTEKQTAMFKSDIEAVYFTGHDEAISKLEHLIKNDSIRNKIAENGYVKAINGGYQLEDRVKEIISVINKNKRRA